MTRMQERSATCPVCANTFGYEVLLSTNAAGGVESDFRARAVGADPVPFTVLTCPRCSYSANTATFEIPVPPAVAYHVKELADRLLDGRHSRRFLLAAELLEKSGEEPQHAAWMFLRSSWLARDEADAAGEERAQRHAIAAFQRYLGAQRNAEDAGQVTYLIGELSRRLGDFETACAQLAAVPASERVYPTAQKMLARAKAKDRAPARFGE